MPFVAPVWATTRSEIRASWQTAFAGLRPMVGRCRSANWGFAGGFTDLAGNHPLSLFFD